MQRDSMFPAPVAGAAVPPCGTLLSGASDPPRMRVLLGIGGSDDSLTALEKTVERSRAADDDLTVAVVENPEADASLDDVESQVRSALEGAAVDAEVRRVEGDAGSRLVEIAETEGFDLIALGGGQTSPMGKINLGQIAQFVLLNSHVSVTLVR